jgi:phosphoglycolate phosphatase-like HAD superfamily hydrolase
MEAAKAAGARAIGYDGGYRPARARKAAGADAIVRELPEVANLLLGAEG